MFYKYFFYIVWIIISAISCFWLVNRLIDIQYFDIRKSMAWIFYFIILNDKHISNIKVKYLNNPALLGIYFLVNPNYID